MTTFALALGTSLGDREARLAITVQRLSHTPGIDVVRSSRIYRSPPMRGGHARNPFCNAVVRGVTSLGAEALLVRCQQLERDANRRRRLFWGDRTLDVDILLWGDLVRDDALLTLPHPGIGSRSFFLRPLLEVWPDACCPATGTAYASLDTPSPRAWPSSGHDRRGDGGPSAPGGHRR